MSQCPKLHVFCHFAHELLSPLAEICMLKTPRPDYLAKTENTEKKETKKMRNIWKKLTASLLALVLTVQLLPVSALADEFEIDDERHDTFTYEQPDVSGEIPELRGEYEKHFSLSDGTYSAVVYPYAVHYDEDGTWQEIDNTLRSGSETYMVAAEPGVELAELLPAEQDGGLTTLSALTQAADL